MELITNEYIHILEIIDRAGFLLMEVTDNDFEVSWINKAASIITKSDLSFCVGKKLY